MSTYIRSDRITTECRIQLLRGDSKVLPEDALVKYISDRYWPSGTVKYLGFYSETVLVHSQFGMGWIEKQYLMRGNETY